MKNKSYQCSACKGKICVTQCDDNPTYCPSHLYKNPCWVEVEQEDQIQASTDLKEGDWAWGPVATYGDKDIEEYFKVLEVLSEGRVRANPYTLVFSKYCQKASVRPYRGPELARMVGKVVKLHNLHQRSFMTASLVLGCNEETGQVFMCTCSSNTAHITETVMGRWVSAEELSGLTTVDGEPCGVLQHRDPVTGELVD